MSNIVPFEPNSSLALASDVLEKYKVLSDRMTGNTMGIEDGRDWRPAHLKMVQAMTTDPAKPDNAKPGDFFHKGGLVKRPLRGVLAYAWHSRVRFVQGQDKSPSCASENVDTRGRGENDKSTSVYGDSCAKCPFGDQPFSKKGNTNCNNQISVIFIPESLEEIFQISFSKTGYTVGKQFTDLARATPKAWSRFYNLDTEIRKRDKGGMFAVPAVIPVADTQVPEHLQAFAEYVCKMWDGVRKEQKTVVRKRRDDTIAAVSDLDTLVVDAETTPGKGYKDAF